MSELLLLHHAQGLTAGCVALAEELRAAGHVVHAPDLYDGRTFDELDDGLAYARSLGFDVIDQRASATAEELPHELVYVGLSLGVMTAQRLTQTRPGARGAVLLHAAVPLEEFGGSWPAGVRAQIHTMEQDDWGDVAEARELASAVDEVELFLYPGDRHLFTDRSLAAYDEGAAGLVLQRVLAFLAELHSR